MNKGDYVIVENASTNNLKNVNVSIKKHSLTAVVGISGSGKTSLVYDTIAAVSRRALNSTFPSFTQNYLPKFGRPEVDNILNLPVVIVVDQKPISSNKRSTLGTYTDAYTYLRLLYSRVGKPIVPHSDMFSFNNPEGMCPNCEGLGEVYEFKIENLIDFNKSLNEGAIDFPTFGFNQWRWKRYAYSGYFDLDKKIADYSENELNLLLYSSRQKIDKDSMPDNWPKSALYEGLIPRFKRSILSSTDSIKYKKKINRFASEINCPVCKGTRINKRARLCEVNGLNMEKAVNMTIIDLRNFVLNIDDKFDSELFMQLDKKLSAIIRLGLGYLSLNSNINKLSGTENLRIKMSLYISNPLSDVMYIFDEPCAGLNEYDVDILMDAFDYILNKSNSILIVEHNELAVKKSNYIIDMGNKSGEDGGKIHFDGTYDDYMIQPSITDHKLDELVKTYKHSSSENHYIEIKDIEKNNIKVDSIEIPTNKITCIQGNTGAGKTTLCSEISKQIDSELISQNSLFGTIRSTILTSMGIFDKIRNYFAKANHVTPAYFSYNSLGACPKCKGTGQVVLDMSFLDPLVNTCPLCLGDRYDKKVGKWLYRGVNIIELLNLTVTMSMKIFETDIEIQEMLEILCSLGLGHLKLGQGLSKMSGGELQRFKIAKHLMGNVTNSTLIIDSPMKGLHKDNILQVLESIVFLVEKRKNTVVIADNSKWVSAISDKLILLERSMNGKKTEIKILN